MTEDRPILVTHVLYSMHTGGLEKGVATLICNASPGIEHVVVCLSTAGATAERLPASTRVIEMNKPPGNSIRFLWRLARTLRKLKPDVVHTRNWGGLDGVIATRLAGLSCAVHGEHGWDMGDLEGLDAKRTRVRRFLSRWVREYTCVSKDMVEWLVDQVRIRKPITQIYNGVDLSPPTPTAAVSLRSELGIGEQSALVGTVGRLDPVKDHVSVIRAVQDLRAEGLDVHAIVAGGGPEEAALRAIASPGIHLLGNRADVPRILRALDVFVLASFNEGISNTILEAMAAALPVVARRVGGNPELIEDGVEGRLVGPRGHEEMRETIRGYILDPESRRRHGEAGRRRVVDSHSVEGMVAAYEGVWRRIAGG